MVSGVDIAIGLAAVAVVAVPIVVRHRAFFADWGSHLYLVDQQARVVQHSVLPTFFLHADYPGVFYPHYMFYGGTLYTVTGWLGALLGSSLTAYRLTFLFGFAATYFSVLWIARQAGVRGLVTHIPAVVSISAAYYLSKVYNDGGWPEFMALSMIPLVAASAGAMLIAKRVSITSGLLLVIAMTLLTGSHTITLVSGVAFLLAIAAVLAIVYRDRVRKIALRRFGFIALLAGAAAGMNGWFLVPLVRYQSHTLIGSIDRTKLFANFDGVAAGFSSWSVILNPMRTYPSLGIRSTHPLYVQIPVYALAWAVCIGAALLARRDRSRATRLYASLVALVTVLLVLICTQGLWDHMPEITKVIQFRFRLSSYAALTIVALVIIGLVSAMRWRRAAWWVATAVLAAAIGLGLAGWQAWNAKQYKPLGLVLREGTRLPPISYSGCTAPCPNVFNDYRFPNGNFVETAPPVIFDVAATREDGTATAVVRQPGVFRTNAIWSPMLTVSPNAEILGVNSVGQAVIRVPKSTGATAATPKRITLSSKATPAVWAGCAVTAISAAVLAGLLGVAVWRRRTHRGNDVASMGASPAAAE